MRRGLYALALVAACGGGSSAAPDGGGGSGALDGGGTDSRAQSSDGGASDDTSVGVSSEGGSTEASVGADASLPDDSPAGGALDGSSAPFELGGLCTPHWCWANPLPQGNAIAVVWASSATSVWAGAGAGVLLHWDGSAWTRFDVGSTSTIRGLWGSSDGDIWATDTYSLWHYDGSTWRKDTSPVLTGHSPWSISGTGPRDVWIASLNFAAQSPALHFDGTSWSEVPGAPVAGFDAVNAASPSQVWFAGGSNTAYTGLYRWDGASWHTDSTLGMVALWSSGPNDLWFDESGSLGHSNAATFTPVYQNLSMRPEIAPWIFGSGPADVWAIGSAYQLVHWSGGDAGAFVQTTFPANDDDSPLCGTSTGVNAVVVGGTTGRLWSAHGASAALMVPPLPPAGQTDFAAVWSDAATGTVLAGGAEVLRGTLSGSGPNAAYTWTELPSITDSGTLHGVTGLWGTSATNAWAVAHDGRLFHYDGTQLTDVPSGLPPGSPAPANLYAVAGTGASDVWAVGESGAVTHFDGKVWTASQSPGVADLLALWIDPQTGDPWACGKSGVLQHHTAANGWQVMSGVPTADFDAIWGMSASDLWLAGPMLEVVHFDGVTFKTLTPPDVANTITAIGGDGVGGIVALADGGVALHYDGTTWSVEETTTTTQFGGLWLDSQGAGWAVGNAGVILRRRP